MRIGNGAITLNWSWNISSFKEINVVFLKISYSAQIKRWDCIFVFTFRIFEICWLFTLPLQVGWCECDSANKSSTNVSRKKKMENSTKIWKRNIWKMNVTVPIKVQRMSAGKDFFWKFHKNLRWVTPVGEVQHESHICQD